MTFGFTTSLFWDIKPGSLDLRRNKKLIIQRIVERGSMNDFRLLRKFYSEAELREGIRQIVWEDPRDRAFLSNVFDIPLNELKCYTGRPFHRHWINY